MTIGDEFSNVLAAAQARDPRAVETIYRDTAGLVIGYLRANGAPEPEDAASEVFVSMLASIGQFSGTETQFRSWLLTIAHRRMVDGFRRTARRREDPVPTDELGDRMIDLTGADTQAMARLRSLGIIDAIDALTPDQRSVLLLRALADLPVRDIAEIVGKPQSAVKALLRRAVASLARTLDERGQAGTA